MTDQTDAPRLTAAPMAQLVRLHLIDWVPNRNWPWLLVVLSFAINLYVISIVDDEARAQYWTGGLMTIYVGTFIVCLFTMTGWLPFALGHGVTRTRFYLSALFVSGGQCLAFAAVLTVLLAIERATDGWGQTLQFFGPSPLVVDNLAAQLVVYAVSLAAAGTWGMVWGLVFRRWGPKGVLSGLILTLLALLGLIVVLARPGVWTAVVDWHVGRPKPALLLLWSLLPAGVAAVVGYALIRPTTPA
jgi:hypothetical protein